MEARTYAQNLRKESQAKGYQAQEQLRTVLSANLSQLKDYLEKVQELRRAFQDLMLELEPPQPAPEPRREEEPQEEAQAVQPLPEPEEEDAAPQPEAETAGAV